MRGFGIISGGPPNVLALSVAYSQQLSHHLSITISSQLAPIPDSFLSFLGSSVCLMQWTGL
ncbi:unknown protein [Microcystis aeruginosa NIES-843]|uniref:Uncharacterized protein n=1 Tax=Microcystis aeruginosa (strain NIES-843 / IAM M-2473) TaxID=449447 RepID=B0JQ16_MICAN|nr:unknown protein [Microcystis aeruginosa NIES-843]